MPSGKRKPDDKLEINDSPKEKRVRSGQQDADSPSFFGVKQELDDLPEGPADSTQESEVIQNVKLERKKHKGDEDSDSEESKVKRIKVSKEENKAIKQETKAGAGYFSDDDAIVLDGLPKRNELDVVSQPQDRTIKKRKADGAPEINVPLKEKTLKINHEDKGKLSEIAQEQDRSAKPVNMNVKARQVEGYYSNDDVTILLDALLKRNGFERIRGGDQQDVVKNIQTGVNTRTMVLAPIAEGSEEAIAGLIRDVTRAHNNDIEQILVPVNMPGIHWYTIQLLMLQIPGGYSLEARIHDSLGIRKSSIIVEKLAAGGIAINSHLEGDLPKIQRGALGAKNVYCGGYTARLIAHLALNGRMIGEGAWGCPNNMDNVLRQEDARIVSDHNSANAGIFGAFALHGMLDIAHYMSAIRSTIAEEKKFKLLKELEADYEAIPMEIKIRIKSINIPKAPAELFAIVRDLYASLPLLKALFQTNAQGEIEKDAEGILKLDMSIEIEHIHRIMTEFQKKCFQLGRVGIPDPQDDGAEAANQDMAPADGLPKVAENHAQLKHDLDSDGSDAELEDEESAVIKKGIASAESFLKMMKKLHTGDHADVATILSCVGAAHEKLRNDEQCLDFHKQALKMRQSLYKGNHPDIAKSLNAVGGAYHNLGDYSKALDYFEQTLKMRQSLYGDDHPDIAESLNNVGVTYHNSEDYSKALDYFEQALNMRQSLYEGDHPAVVESLNNINAVGNAYYNLDDYTRALECYEQTLKIRQLLYKGDHPDVATSLTDIGHAHRWLKNHVKALEYHEQALKMRQSLYGDDHPDIAESLNNVGVTYHNSEDYSKALDYFEQALNMRQSLYEGDHPDIVESLNNVGVTCRNSEDYSKSLDYFEQALKMRQALHKGNHPDVAELLNKMGVAYLEFGRAKKGLDYIERGLAMREALYPGNHPSVSQSLDSAGQACWVLGHFKKSLAYYKRSLAMDQALHQGDHEDIADSLNNVGLVHNDLREVREGIGYLERSLTMRQALHKGNHPDVAASLNNVGLAHNKLRNFVKSIEYLELALAMREALYQGDHYDIVESLNNLGLACKMSGDVDKSLEFQGRAKMMKDALKKPLKKESSRKKSLKKPQKQGKKVEEKFKGQGTLSYMDNSYPEYYNSGLDHILGLRLNSLGSNSNVVVLRSRYFEEGRGSAEKLVQDVITIFSYGDTQIVLAPVNSQDKHWLGLSFRNLGDMVEVTYMDSEQVAILPELRAELENGLAINGYESRFLEARLAPQRYNNCGYEVIENFVYYLTGTRATQEGAVYVHSLLVENNLLDPKDYGLKLEENSRLIGFLSNAVPIEIMELPFLTNQGFAVEGVLEPSFVLTPAARIPAVPSTTFGFRWTNLKMTGVEAFCKKLLYRQDLRRFGGMLGDYSIELPNGMTGFDVLLDNSKFNKLVMNKIHPDKNPFGADVGHEDTLFVRELRGKVADDLDVMKLLEDGIARVNPILHKASVGFKALDVVVDSARLAYEPNMLQAKKLVLDCAHLHGLMVGANGYSLAISCAEAGYQLYSGEYQKAFDVTYSTLSAMALPVILAQVNRPYLGFAYGALVAATNAYNALANAYSFVQELATEDAFLKSQIAYEELAEWLRCSVLNNMAYDGQEYEYYMK